MANPRQRRKLKAGKSAPSRSKLRKMKAKSRDKKIVTVSNSIIGKQWDGKKTIQQNFAALGLVSDPNAMLTSDKGRQRICNVKQPAADGEAGPMDEITDIQRDTIKALEELAAKATTYEAYASRGETHFVQDLLEKHGTDFVAMAKDHKLNMYQHTPAQLKQKVEKYYNMLEKLAVQASREKK